MERRGSLAFEKELADPRELIAGDGCGGQPPPVASDRLGDHDARDKGRSGKMQPSADWIAVLGAVVRLELSEAGIMLFHGGAARQNKPF